MKKIVAIVPTAGEQNMPLLKKCILSLVKAAEKEVELHIVVNTERPITKFPSFGKFIDYTQTAVFRSGYALRHNNALEYVFQHYKSDYILFINDDAWVEKDFFKELIKMKKSVDIIAPKIISGDGPELDSFGVEYFRSGYSKNNNFENIPTQLASASCALVSTSILKEIKAKYGFYFNEILGWYVEDVELFIRARALGARVERNKNMVAHHIGSFTWGKKSFFCIFQTYRNVIWVTWMTWPAKDLLRNLPNIILVQGWAVLYSLFNYGPQLYFKVIIQTVQNFVQLTRLRRKILAAYPSSFKLSSIFSSVAFRTYHGKVIQGI